MPRWTLERRLVAAVLVLFLIPTVVAGGVLFGLYRAGSLADPLTLAAAAGVGLVLMMAYLGLVTHGIGRTLVRSLQEIQLGAELMATVNPTHRLRVEGDDEIAALAAEINRMADRAAEGRQGLEREVTRATRELAAERETLAAVLAALGEGAVVATPDGRVTLANARAETLLGAAAGGLLGRSLFDFVDREKVAHYLEQLSTGPGTAERFSLHPPGGQVLEAAMTPFLDGERRSIGSVLLLRDVTRRARADEAEQRRLAEAAFALRGGLASVRSLAESLATEPGVAAGPVRRLVEALHADAVRLSELVRGLIGSAPPGPVPSMPFEALSAPALVAMAVRRLDPGAAERVATDESLGGLGPLRVESSALSGAIAQLLRATLGVVAGPVWVGGRRRGRVRQIEIEAAGGGAAGALEPVLDAPLPGGVAAGRTVRDVVREHAGEIWSQVGDDRVGFRLTLPEGAGHPDEEHPGATGLAGAGTVSGFDGAGRAAPRPPFYDFSLFDEMERHLPATDLVRTLAELDYVVLDTETTGLQPDGGDRIVSLAGVRVRGGAVRRGEVFDALVNPARPIPPASVRFHGITDAMVAAAPRLDVVLPAFLRFAEGAVLVGHEVSFDLAFLGAEARRLGLAPLERLHPVLDTLPLSAAVHGALPGHALEVVAERLGVAIEGRHSALGDALATAEVLVRLLALLQRRGIGTLGQALAAARRARGLWPGSGALPVSGA